MRAADLEEVASAVHRLAALTAGGVPLHAAWGYLDGVEPEAVREHSSAAWRMCDAALAVAVDAGAPVAAVLSRLAEALRERAAVLRSVDVALAGPKATARLVTALPLVGIGFGIAVGLDPIGALLGSPIGIVALVMGLGLGVAAWLWSRRIVAAAGRGSPTAGLALELVGVALSGGVGIERARALVERAMRERGLASVDGAALDETLALAEAAGVPARALLAAEAQAARLRERLAGETRAARAAVHLVIPLGVCVLPAFGLLAVVPLVLSMLQSTFTPLGL